MFGSYKIRDCLYRPVAAVAKKVLPSSAVFYLRTLKLRKQYKDREIPQDLKNKKIFLWEEFAKKVLITNQQPIVVHQQVIPWFTPLFQRPQHMATAFAKLGCLSLYVTDELRYGFVKLDDNLWLASVIDSEKIENAFRLFYSTAGNLKYWYERCPKNSRFVYEYIDHIDPKISWSYTDNLREGYQFATSGKFYRVLASSKNLFNELAQEQHLSKDTLILVPNGVNVSDYEKENYFPSEDLKNRFSEFSKKYKKIVGYFGALANWLDYDLINSIVTKRKDLGFVFIGPDYLGGAEKLHPSENMLYLGPVNYSELPYFSLKFDIAWIPFERGDIAKATSPLKLFEYFAMQKPVVVTQDLIECQVYDEVFVAHDLDDLSRVFDKALSVSEDKNFKMRLRKLAQENDWIVRAQHYLDGLK